MDYFLNGVLNEKNTIIETNLIERLKIFTALGRPATAILTEYDPLGASFLAKNKIDHAEHLYNWIQEAQSVPAKRISRDDLPELDNFQREWVKDSYTYTQGSRLLARANFARYTLEKITYYTESGARASEQLYDQRGFLSSEILFDANEKRMLQTFFNPAGESCLLVQYGKKEQPVFFELVKWHNFFFSVQDLVAFCLAQMMPAADVIISERRELDNYLPKISANYRLIRLYNSPFSGDSTGIDYILARRENQLTIDKAVLLDEYSEDGLKKWQAVLEKRVVR